MRFLAFTAEELGSEVKDLLRKVGVHMGPDIIRKIVADMDRNVQEERLEKERQARKKADHPDTTFAEMQELNRRVILSAYGLTPGQLARAQGFFIPDSISEIKPGHRAQHQMLPKTDPTLAQACGVTVSLPVDACECGVYKATGAHRGNPTHSSWCPWSRP